MSSKKFTIFSVIDHQKGAKSVNLPLKGNTLIIFGNPKGGTPLMQENPLLGHDLPLKILITEGANKNVKVSYRNPESYSTQYGIKKNVKLLKKIKKAFDETLEVVLK